MVRKSNIYCLRNGTDSTAPPADNPQPGPSPRSAVVHHYGQTCGDQAELTPVSSLITDHLVVGGCSLSL